MIGRWAAILAIGAIAACSGVQEPDNDPATAEAAKPVETAAFSCPPHEPVSFETLLKHHRAILVGEMHGTTEMPAAFGEMVETAASSGKRIAVALEFDRRWQADIDAVMDAPDMASAKAAFAERATFDGRSSGAMRNLLYRLRQLKQDGADIHVFAIDFWEHAGEPKPHTAPEWLPDEVDVEKALRDVRQGEKSVADCLAVECDTLMFFAGNMHTRPVISESFTLNSETGETTSFVTAPAGAIIAHEMPTTAIYLAHSGGTIEVNIGDGLKEHRWKSSAPDFAIEERIFYCTPEGSRHGVIFNVGTISASSDPTKSNP